MVNYDDFKNPGEPYRGKPFWSWNGKLEPDELRRQLRVFKKMGMGGAFLHSRVGLATEFLGKDWFDCIRASVEECRAQGMTAWLYDEDRWPSGSAGGLVTQNKKYRMVFLSMHVFEAANYREPDDCLGVWEATLDGYTATDLVRLKEGEKPSGKNGRKILAFSVREMNTSSWYNGGSYLDTMSADAVKKFIDVSYKPYAKEIGEDFGDLVPGIFTDEPNYWPVEISITPGEIAAHNPWTRKLPKVFKQRYGYNLLKHLPEIFFDLDGEKVSKVRVDYRDCATALFVENYAQQIGEWCERHNLLFTGHVLYENSLRNQTLCVGSTMRFYEHMQAPGIDILTQTAYEYDTAKQTASVHHQMGRKWLLSELYGVTGWDFTWEGHKAVGDWQAALGVNLRCHHLSWYTMQGEAKRDYPASIFFQSPWWEYYRVVEDYYARLHVLLTAGEPVRRALVIHPIESMWMRYKLPVTGLYGGENIWEETGEAAEINNIMINLRDWLLQAHIDFDYGDEEMMSRLSAIDADEAGARFKLGVADYDVIIVPPQLTIRSTTLKLLKKFQAAGGTVIFAGDIPPAVDAEYSDKAAAVAEQCLRAPFTAEGVVGAVEGKARRVSITGAKGKESPQVLHMLRRDGEDNILFICNTDRKAGTGELTIRMQGTGRVACLDAASGERCALESSKKNGWVEFKTELPATGSALFVVGPNAADGLKKKPALNEKKREPLRLARGRRLSEPNVLVLDRPKYKIGEARLQGPLEILKVDKAVRDKASLEHRSGQMTQPWARPVIKHEEPTPVELCYTFQVDAVPSGPVHLALETPGRFQVSLNGYPVPTDIDTGEGWWVDPSLKRLRLDPAALVAGENELVLKIDYLADDGLEACFLLGDFGVSVQGTKMAITAPPAGLKLGSWVEQGLPFYGGSVTYNFLANPKVGKGQRLFLSAPDFKGTMARVLVNGKEAGFLPWPPYELDLTPYLEQGELEIALEVFGSRRNTFGPLHQKVEQPWVGPDSFQTSGNDWEENYVLKPCGLLKAPILSWRA